MELRDYPINSASGQADGEDPAKKPLKDLYLIVVSLFFWGLGEGCFYVFQPLYLQELGADPALIGGVLSMAAVAMSLGHIPFGILADKVGRRPIIWGSWFIALTSVLMMGIFTNLTGYVFGLLLYSLTYCVTPSLNAYTSDARGSWSPARALTFASAGFNGGALLGPILGGFLADLVGLRMVYLVAAVIFLISTLIVLFIRKQDIHEKSMGQSIWTPLRNRRFSSFLILLLLMMFSFYLPQTLAPNFLQDYRGLGFTQVGQLASLMNLGAMIFNLSLTHLEPLQTFVFAQVAFALFAILFLWGKGVLGYALAYLLLGLGRVAATVSSAVVRPMVHPSQLGLTFGVLETIKSLAMSLAALAAGLLYARNPQLLYWVSLTTAILVLFLTLVYQRYLYTASKT